MPARGRPPTMSRQRDRGTVRRTHPIDLISSEPNQRIPPSPWESCLGPFWNDSWAAIQDPLRDAQRSQDTAVDLDIKVDVKAAHGYVFALRRTSWSANVSPPDGPQPGVRLKQPLSPRPRFRCSQCRQANWRRIGRIRCWSTRPAACCVHGPWTTSGQDDAYGSTLVLCLENSCFSEYRPLTGSHARDGSQKMRCSTRIVRTLATDLRACSCMPRAS